MKRRPADGWYNLKRKDKTGWLAKKLTKVLPFIRHSANRRIFIMSVYE